MIGQRVCRRNTDETRIVMLKIWKELSDFESGILCVTLFTGPFCQRERCLEGKMACGRKLAKEMGPDDILRADYPLLYTAEKRAADES